MNTMTKKVFAVIVGIFLLGVLLGLVGLNSFFQENLRLLQERNKVDIANKIITKENMKLRRLVPPVPKGAVIEGMRVSVDPETAKTESPKYILTLWVKNPTDKEILGVRGVLYIQGLGAGSRLEYIPITTPMIAAGERRLFSSDPMTIGGPGSTVEIIASLWSQPGVAKVLYHVPAIKVPEKTESKPNNQPGQSDQSGQSGQPKPSAPNQQQQMQQQQTSGQ
jgi:hypothetical protein